MGCSKKKFEDMQEEEAYERQKAIFQNGNDGLHYDFDYKKKDAIVENLKKEFDIRSKIGIKKYNTTLEENNNDDFLQHLKEELMDACLYITKLQSKINKLNK